MYHMEQNNSERELLSIYQAAGRLGVAPKLLRKAVRTGDLHAYKPGRRTVYVLWSDLMAWLQTQRVTADPATCGAHTVVSDERP